MKVRAPTASTASSDDAATSGDFDLNATPRGFDLNAPLPEEEGDWMPAEPVPHENSEHQKSLKRTRSSNTALKQQVEPAAKLGIDEDLDILQSVWNSQDDHEQLDGILASLCEDIAKQPSGPPKYQYLTCVYISKKLPSAFIFPRTYKVLLSFLDPNGPGSLSKKQNVLPPLACRILYRAFCDEPQWPLDFVKVYLEDAVNSRNWVDNENCKEFVGNVLTAFRYDDQDTFMGDDVQENASKGDNSSTTQGMVIKNRYPQDDLRQEARMDFLRAINLVIRVPSAKESPRVLHRFLMLGFCYEEVRNVASTMLENWLNNPVHFRGAKLLLDRLIHHTNTTSPQDLETVTNLLAFKLSPQAVGQAKGLYSEIVLQVVQKRTEYSAHALKTFLTVEMNQKASQNVKGIAAVLRALPDSQSPERELASVIKELLVKEEHVNRLLDTVGRVTKQLSREVSPFLLSRALLEPWSAIQQEEEPVRLAWLNSVSDLACRQLIQAASSLTFDESIISAISSSDAPASNESLRETFAQLESFSMKVVTFQVEALTWCIDVLNTALPQMPPSQFAGLVRKLQFLELLQEYSLSSSNSDAEINSFQLVAYCMHASEEILARIILMGISSQFPMDQADALNIIENLVWRAAASRNRVFGTLFADNNQLPAAVVKLSSMNIAATQQQQFVFKDMFWRSCLVILVIAVHNPSTIGRFVWDNLMPLKSLLECLVTETTILSQEAAQLEEAETMESNLKAQEAMEALLAEERSNSEPWSPSPKWEGNIMLASLANGLTKPPKFILEELGQVSKTYQLGRRLRRCQDPNFLKDTINSQDFKQAWTWMKEVVANDPEVAGLLPSDWQCELLYMHELSGEVSRLQEIRMSMYKLVEDNNAEELSRVIKRLASKLMSPSCAVRSCARRCFAAFLKDAETVSPNCTWLDVIEKLQTPGTVETMVSALQEALVYENSTPVILSYLAFLKKHLSPALFTATFARFVVQRKLISSSLLRMPVADTILEVFSKTMKTCSEKGGLDWENTDSPLVNLILPGVDFTVPAIVLEAVVEILAGTSSAFKTKPSYFQLLQLLFPGYTEGDGGDHSMVLKELDSGIKAPFLTKLHASLLVRTDDIRLVKAGLSLLEFREKIQLLKEFKLSATAKTCLAEEMKDLPDASFKTLPSLATRERLHLQSCLEALCGGPGTSSRDDSSAPSRMDCTEPLEEETQMKSNPIVARQQKPNIKEYLPFRVLVQKLVLGKTGDNLNSVLDALNCIHDNQDGAQAVSLVLVLPVLTILIEAGKTETSSILEVVNILLKIMPKLRHNNQVSEAAAKFLKHLKTQLLLKLGGNLSEDTEEVSGDVPLGKFEQAMRKQLGNRLENYLKQDTYGTTISSLLQYVIARLKEQGRHSGQLSDIEVAGTHGMLISFLSFIHPDTLMSGKDISVFFTEQLIGGRSLEFTSLVLELLLHKCKNKSGGLARGLWDAVVLNLDIEQTLTENSCRATGLLLEFLYLNRNALRFGNSSSRVLATLSVISCTMEGENRKNIFSTTIKLLLHAASTHGVMHLLIKQLKSLSREKDALSSAASELVCALYMAYPVTVGSSVDMVSEGSTFLMDAPQALGFHDFVNRAITASFLNPKNSGVSALCFYFARKHPGLFIRHFSTMRFHLQENWSNLEIRTPLLVFTVELLDALQPSVLCGDQSLVPAYSDDLEALLELFFNLIGNSDASCTEQFVDQLASFLCHIVPAGGRLSQLVRAHKRGIQSAYYKFGKPRKLAKLMQLLDTGSLPASSSDTEELSMEEVRKVLSSSQEVSAYEDTWNILGAKDDGVTLGLNLVTVLDDLEKASARRPGVLANMEELVARLLTVENVEVQERAYLLVKRFLHQNSGNTSQTFVNEMIRQITSPGTTQQQMEIITRNISKLFFYFEEYQQDILIELFRKGKTVCQRLNEIVCDAQMD